MTPEQRRAAVLARRAAARPVLHESEDGLEELELAYQPVYGPPLVLTPYIEKVRKLRVQQVRPEHFDRPPVLPPLPPEYIAPEHLRLFRRKRVSLLPVELELPLPVQRLLPFLEDGDKTLPHYYQLGRSWHTITWRELQWSLRDALQQRLRPPRDRWLVAELCSKGWHPIELMAACPGLVIDYWRKDEPYRV